MLELVRKALRITTTSFDDELQPEINAALLDLGVAGVTEGVLTEDADALVKLAVITYCKMRFGEPDEYDRLKASYDEQKAQLVTCTGYTDWGEGIG